MKKSGCVFLPWDSEFFSHRIARVVDRRLSAASLASITEYCVRHSIECLYFLADSGDPETIRLAEDHGFRLVEIRVSYERSLEEWTPGKGARGGDATCIRRASSGDIPALRKIAADIYGHSRFFYDDRFTRDQWRSFYSYWIQAACEGRSDIVLVAERKGRMEGFITGLVNGRKKEGRLELIGVASDVRGGGIGRILALNCMGEMKKIDMSRVFVDTQGTNIETQRHLQRLGFVSMGMSLYYHKWFS